MISKFLSYTSVRGWGQWPAREKDRDPDSQWLRKKYERATMHRQEGSSRPSNWRPTAQVRGTACSQCSLNDYATFCTYWCCARCCLKRGGCGSGTHVLTKSRHERTIGCFGHGCFGLESGGLPWLLRLGSFGVLRP